uniref:Uncharacterized protein n=1 Tax=Tetranychus urticae TaxID=32264 RepID=T1KL35_TETUR
MLKVATLFHGLIHHLHLYFHLNDFDDQLTLSSQMHTSHNLTRFSFSPESDNRFEKIYLKFISQLPSNSRYSRFTPKSENKLFTSDKRVTAFWEDQYESPLRGSLMSNLFTPREMEKNAFQMNLNLNMEPIKETHLIPHFPLPSTSSSSLEPLFTDSPLPSLTTSHFGFTQEPSSTSSGSFNLDDKRERNLFRKRKFFREQSNLNSMATSTHSKPLPSMRSHKHLSTSDLVGKESRALDQLASPALVADENNCRTIVKQVTELPGVRPKKIVKLIRSRRALNLPDKHLITFYMSKNCTEPLIKSKGAIATASNLKTVKVSIYRQKFLNSFKLPEEVNFDY